MDRELLNSEGKLGLALGGGFVRAAASIGVIEELIQSGVNPEAISGSSSGALVAAAYATGRLFDLKSVLFEYKNWLDFFDVQFSSQGLLRGEKIQHWLDNFFGKVKIEKTRCPLYIQTSDLLSGEEIYCQKGLVADLVGAAMRIPGFEPPYRCGGYLLVDGGARGHIPGKISGCDY